MKFITKSAKKFPQPELIVCFIISRLHLFFFSSASLVKCVCVYVVYNTTIFSYSFSPLILTTHELTRQEGARREYKRGGGDVKEIIWTTKKSRISGELLLLFVQGLSLCNSKLLFSGENESPGIKKKRVIHWTNIGGSSSSISLLLFCTNSTGITTNYEETKNARNIFAAVVNDYCEWPCVMVKHAADISQRKSSLEPFLLFFFKVIFDV